MNQPNFIFKTKSSVDAFFYKYSIFDMKSNQAVEASYLQYAEILQRMSSVNLHSSHSVFTFTLHVRCGELERLVSFSNQKTID